MSSPCLSRAAQCQTTRSSTECGSRHARQYLQNSSIACCSTTSLSWNRAFKFAFVTLVCNVSRVRQPVAELVIDVLFLVVVDCLCTIGTSTPPFCCGTFCDGSSNVRTSPNRFDFPRTSKQVSDHPRLR